MYVPANGIYGICGVLKPLYSEWGQIKVEEEWLCKVQKHLFHQMNMNIYTVSYPFSPNPNQVTLWLYFSSFYFIIMSCRTWYAYWLSTETKTRGSYLQTPANSTQLAEMRLYQLSWFAEHCTPARGCYDINAYPKLFIDIFLLGRRVT